MTLNVNDTKTRITQDDMNGGKWQAQYWDAEAKLWFDIGDGKTTREEAEATRLEAKRSNLNEAQLNLLRSYLDGPKIWDAASLFGIVVELDSMGLIQLTGSRGKAELTDAGRALLAQAEAS